jgi:GNAT superfamily N-acetyltransferase
MRVITQTRGEYTLTTDPARLDFEAAFAYLSGESYWARGIPREMLARAFEHSLTFSLLRGDRQVGLARVVTDYATFAWLADVYVLESERGQGLGKWLVEAVKGHPDLQNLRMWLLATRDAHDLYRRYGGFTDIESQRFLGIRDAEVYARLTAAGGDA